LYPSRYWAYEEYYSNTKKYAWQTNLSSCNTSYFAKSNNTYVACIHD
jgi:hypothetical protein